MWILDRGVTVGVHPLRQMPNKYVWSMYHLRGVTIRLAQKKLRCGATVTTTKI